MKIDINSLSEIIILVDSNFKNILDINRACEFRLKYNRLDLVGKEIKKILPNTEYNIIKKSKKIYTENLPIKLIDNNGDNLNVLMTILPKFNDNDDHILLVSRDLKNVYFNNVPSSIDFNIDVLNDINKIIFDLIFENDMYKANCNLIDFAIKLLGAEFGYISFSIDEKDTTCEHKCSLLRSNKMETINLSEHELSINLSWVYNHTDGNFDYKYFDDTKNISQLPFKKKIENCLIYPILYNDTLFGTFGFINLSNFDIKYLENFRIFFDISGRIQAIKKKYNFLSDELKKNKKITDHAITVKNRFLANMSHEIRTPMNGIYGMLSILKTTSLNTQQEDYVDTCLRSSEALMNVLDDILLFSKADSEAIKLEHIPFNMNNVIEDIMQISSGNILPTKELDLVYLIDGDVPLHLIGDPSRLRQILLNLISNAIKFTNSGDICVKLSCMKIDKDMCLLKFSVEDTGIGMTQNQIKKLFKPFSQADSSTTRKYGGSGLGLSICKKLVKLYNGDISVTSIPGKGSIFTFTCEFKIDVKNKNIDAYDLTPEDILILKDLKVCVIDDNIINCIALENLLKPYGCKVKSLMSGLDGIDEIMISEFKNNPYDILLLDYHMPVIDGVQVAKILYKKGSQIKIIAVSSAVDHQILLQQPNIKGVSLKPIKKKHLLYLICRSVMSSKPIQYNDDELIEIKQNFGNTKKENILIVEDNGVNRKMIVKILNSVGYNTIEALNGYQAIEIIKNKEKPIDIIIMDIHIPRFDGFKTSKEIRNNGFSGPIIALTADISEGIKSKCLDYGMDDYLVKPVKVRSLIESIDNIKKREKSGILIVDDVLTNLIIIENYLKDLNVNIYKASSGKEAIDFIKKNGEQVNIILLDLFMPVMDGIETAKIILNIIDIPIIGITAESDNNVCLDAGMIDVIKKPVTRNVLIDKLFDYIKLTKNKIELQSEIENTDFSVSNYIDIKQMKSIVGTDKELCKFLLDELCEQIENGNSRFRELINDKNYTKIKEIAHTLRGASSQLGVIFMPKLMQQIENLCTDKKYEDIENIIKKIEPLYIDFKKNIDSVIDLI